MYMYMCIVMCVMIVKGCCLCVVIAASSVGSHSWIHPLLWCSVC